MSLLDADTWLGRMRLLGLISIAIALATWAVDIGGLVYACPYCRTQRTMIGLLGLLMLLPRPGHWMVRWVGSVLATLGLVTAATQNFGGWRRMFAGELEFGTQWYMHPFLLSGIAMFILMAQIMLIHGSAQRMPKAITRAHAA